MVPFHFLMGFSVFFSTLMIMCSSSWISMWVSFEINTLSFMPLMKSKGATKYFLAQSLGSAMILSGVAWNQELLIVFGAMVKAGIAPVHSWFPQVMEHLSWRLCLILSTWQKIGPMTIVFSCCSKAFMMFFIVASLGMGAIGALKQGRLRSILAFSSITHMGWTLSGSMISASVGVLYFFSYCLMSVLVMIKLSKFNSFVSVSKDLSLILMLFSMSGLPPFLGFFPKMWVFLGAPLIICPFLVISSVIMIFVYTSIMFSSVSSLKNVNSWSASFIVMVPMCLVM